eukprot:1893608-Pleurochrysis_carterae.AAC.1
MLLPGRRSSLVRLRHAAARLYKHMTKQKLDNKTFNDTAVLKDYARAISHRILSLTKDYPFTTNQDNTASMTHNQSTNQWQPNSMF